LDALSLVQTSLVDTEIFRGANHLVKVLFGGHDVLSLWRDRDLLFQACSPGRQGPSAFRDPSSLYKVVLTWPFNAVANSSSSFMLYMMGVYSLWDTRLAMILTSASRLCLLRRLSEERTLPLPGKSPFYSLTR
jgi:hypothetical protein